MALFAVLDLGCLLLALFLLKRLLAPKPSLPLPPGPPRLPIVGNLFNWPKSREWETFAEWSKEYGDIVYADIMGTRIVVLNSYDVAMELFHRKGAIYSNRPSLYFVCEMMGWKGVTTLLNEGPELREHRRLIAQQIGSSSLVERFAPMLQMRSQHFLRQILDDSSSDALFRHVRALVASAGLDMTYGYQAKDEKDELIVLADQTVKDSASAARPGAHLVDQINWLAHLPSWFPGTGFKREAADMRERAIEFVEKPFQFAKNAMNTDNFRPSLVTSNLESDDLSPEREESLKWAAAALYGAGSETTESAICSFFLFMTIYPEVQRKAQAEIDFVIGDSRLPIISDRGQMPFVNAIIKEVLRYSIIGPQGLPHVLCEDDVYNAYWIPKNTVIMPNHQGMTRDTRVHKNPDVFDPTRFLGETPELDPMVYVFGVGRRICPGRYFADSNLFLTFSTTLATMNISKAISQDNKEITPVVEYQEGLTVHPKRFQCKITPRSASAEALLRSQLG